MAGHGSAALRTLARIAAPLAVFGVIVALGVVPALADPGNGNGNGDGLASGQPCAGCVGKADNKNPPGQFPNGSDPNAGYECDRNNGIGKTNPAHTGCTAASTPAAPPVPASARSASARAAELEGAVSVPSVSLPGTLPFTGSSVLVLLLVGLASLGAGGALLLLRRLRFRAA